MGNASWFSGIVIGMLLVAFPPPSVCQTLPSGPEVYSVRVRVDSGSAPFSAILNSGEHLYLARREAMRASTVKFSDVPAGMHHLTVDMPGGKRAEHIVEVTTHYAGPRREIRVSVNPSDFRTVAHVLEHELQTSMGGLKVEREVYRLLQQAWPLMERGDLHAAHALLRRAVSLDPHFHEGWVNLGVVAERQNSLHEAVTLYRRALRLAPDCFAANINLSLVFTRLHYYPEALVYARLAFESDPESLAARHHMGLTALRAGKFLEAVPHLAEVIKLNGEDTDTPRLQLAAAYAGAGMPGPAVRVLRDWMRLHPDHPHVLAVGAAMEDLVAAIDR